jgi:hypothetical protein
MGAAYLETNGANVRRRIVRWNAPRLKFLRRAYVHPQSSRSKSYAPAPHMLIIKEGPMLDLLFLGGGVALLCLMIAYARLTNRI